ADIRQGRPATTGRGRNDTVVVDRGCEDVYLVASDEELRAAKLLRGLPLVCHRCGDSLRMVVVDGTNSLVQPYLQSPNESHALGLWDAQGKKLNPEPQGHDVLERVAVLSSTALRGPIDEGEPMAPRASAFWVDAHLAINIDYAPDQVYNAVRRRARGE